MAPAKLANARALSHRVPFNAMLRFLYNESWNSTYASWGLQLCPVGENDPSYGFT